MQADDTVYPEKDMEGWKNKDTAHYTLGTQGFVSPKR